MEQQLPVLDIAVLVVYMAAVVGFGCWFVRKSGTSEEFMVAGRSLPGWAIGLSVFGTFLSSNTFLGVPGKTFGANWNTLVFSLSLPIAALVAVKFFVPFYRKTGEISAYEHLEHRFGAWARIFAVSCYLLTQVARVGSITLLVGFSLSALTGWDIRWIIVATGVIVTLYTMLGGIEAVIWTDVVQSIVLTVGALVVVVLLVVNMPGGASAGMNLAYEQSKFNLGEFSMDFTNATFWVTILYGLFINLKTFGIDQNFIQRYHTAKTDRDATNAVWFGALVYVPVALLFCFIGSMLFAFYEGNPDRLADVRAKAAAVIATENMVESAQDPTDDPDGQQSAAVEGTLTDADYVAIKALVDSRTDPNDGPNEQQIAAAGATLVHADYGDKVFPHFIVAELPPGVTGLIIAAIFAAAMCSIDSSLNSSATIVREDIYRRYINPEPTDRQSMMVLYGSTLLWGALGTGVAWTLIPVKSVLDAWWMLEGLFAGGMLGLFLLGIISRKASSPIAAISVTLGMLVIVWMTLPSVFEDDQLGFLRSPFHANMIVTCGTLTIVLVGLAISALKPTDPTKTDTR
jgi:SSS family solute:Na+ symporter